MRVRGRDGNGASCPSCNLVREVAILSLATRTAARQCVDPVGETAVSLIPSRLASTVLGSTPSGVPLESCCYASASSPSTDSSRPPREHPPSLTVLHPYAAGIDVHSDMHQNHTKNSNPCVHRKDSSWGSRGVSVKGSPFTTHWRLAGSDTILAIDLGR